jgi:hypothetical protein
VLEAENSLREKLSEATSSYEELEEVAVLSGEHEKGKGSRDIPEGRWSYNPDGFFVRYIPAGYTETHIEVYVPELFDIERDEKGRIKLISDRKGSSIELAYDDSMQPLSFQDDSETTAYAFKSVRFVEKLPGGKSDDVLERKWTDTGWTLVGIPNGKGRVESASEMFNGWDKRYKMDVTLIKDFDDSASRVMKARGAKSAALSQVGVKDMVDLCHLRTALGEIVGKEDLKEPWTAHQLDRITNAWQSAFCQRINSIQVACLPAAMINLIGAATLPGPDGPGSGGSGGPGGGAGFGPSGGVAAPGDTAQQRLAPSGRPKRECGNTGDSGEGTGDAIKGALKKHGLDVSDENLDIRESGSGDCKLIRFHVPLGKGGKPLPKLGCMQEAIAGGNVPEGSMEGPSEILFGSVQQCGDETMVTVRKTDIETGEVKVAGRGRSKGTGGSATGSAADDALGGMGL